MTDPEALPDADLSVWPIDDFGWDWDDSVGYSTVCNWVLGADAVFVCHVVDQ